MADALHLQLSSTGGNLLAGKATEGAVLLSEDAQAAPTSCVLKGMFFPLQLMV